MLKAGRLRLPAFMASPARASKMVVDVTQRLQTKCCDAVRSFRLLLPELIHLVGDVIQEHLRVFIWWGCRAINWRLKVEAYVPEIGGLPQQGNIDVSAANVAALDFVVGEVNTITVTIKDAEGDETEVEDLFVELSDPNTGIRAYTGFRNASRTTMGV